MPEVILARCERIIDLYEKKTLIDSAETDTLTGLYTRDFFFEYIKRMDLSESGHMDALVLDIENFHLINEIYGRDEGDSVLKKVAEIIISELEESYGIACRSVADTFYTYHSGMEDYNYLAERISKEMSSHSLSSAKISLQVP